MSVRTIWKFPLNSQSVDAFLPALAKVVLVGLDPVSCVPTVWVELFPSHPTELRRFHIYGTGHPITDNAEHVGSVIDGPFVWHIYEQRFL